MPITPFVLFSTQRSGSTFLRLWLNSHTQIRCHSEVFLHFYDDADGFNDYCKSTSFRKALFAFASNSHLSEAIQICLRQKLTRDYLHSLFHDPDHPGPWTDPDERGGKQPRVSPEMERAVGFKLMYNQIGSVSILAKTPRFRKSWDGNNEQLSVNEKSAFARWLNKENIKVLHLIRNNVLRIYVSRQLAEKRHLYHSTRAVTPVAVTLAPESLVQTLSAIKEQQREMQAILPQEQTMTLYYEQLHTYLEDPEPVLHFLGIENGLMTLPSLQRINPYPFQTLIANYEVVAKVLRGTSYERCLQD